MVTKNCVKCQTLNSEEVTYCVNCGNKFLQESDQDKENSLIQSYQKYFETQNYSKAFSYLLELEKLTQRADVQDNIGAAYFRGLGVDRDYEKAFYWYEKSAHQGFASAQDHLADMYRKGLGVKQDSFKDFHYSLLAAKQNFTNSQMNVAFFYKKGTGVEVNLHESFYWYSRALENGATMAYPDLAIAYYYGRGTPQDINKAIQCYQQALYYGHASNQLILFFNNVLNQNNRY